MNTLYKIKNVALKALIILPSLGVAGGGLSSCSDFLDQTSDRVMNADEAHLNTASDTIYSVLGVVNKMQSIADRTILLGEVRGDLVDVNSKTSADLREVASFSAGTDNSYNDPSDYYGIINNCNYFIANADTALKNGRNEYIFHKEYAVIKAFRAWTYLQLAQNYGSVPFITQPVLTKEESEKDYPKYDIQQICDYFINDLKGLETEAIPMYGTLRNTDSRLFYFPINILLGDLNLWGGHYREAAQCYYKYLNTRNGTNSSSPIGKYSVEWDRSNTKYMHPQDTWSSEMFGSETYGGELITLIPGDSIPAEGNYSQLRNIFNSTESNEYTPSIVASQRLSEISGNQYYCHYTEDGDTLYPSVDGQNKGDLRYGAVYTSVGSLVSNGKSYTLTSCAKYNSQHVHLYRQTMVYLRMAEALNRAGFPRFAYKILQNGVNSKVMEEDILPYYSAADTAFLKQFDFPKEKYITRTSSGMGNTIGIHSHGSGWTERSEKYPMPYDETADPTLLKQYSASDLLNKQIEGVEDYIVDEEALEFAFEGDRFYQLMRVALRRNDPSYLANRVYMRRGQSNVATMKSEIKKDLTVSSNWYLPLP